jgi:undecaprenyl-diphosphatase
MRASAKRSLETAQIIWRKEWLTILVLALTAAGAWAFIEIADEVREGQTQSLDEKLLLVFRSPQDRDDPLGPPWVEEMTRDVTALGSVTLLTLLTASVAGFLSLTGKRWTARLVTVAVVTGFGASSTLKAAFSRPRPNIVGHEMYASQSSFPSGHAMLSAVTYLTLGALLMRVQPRRRVKAYLLVVSVTLTVLVGVSRVYLGVHWPTDVLAGWAAGATWALLWWLVARYLQHRGKIEAEPTES